MALKSHGNWRRFMRNEGRKENITTISKQGKKVERRREGREGRDTAFSLIPIPGEVTNPGKYL